MSFDRVDDDYSKGICSFEYCPTNIINVKVWMDVCYPLRKNYGMD